MVGVTFEAKLEKWQLNVLHVCVVKSEI